MNSSQSKSINILTRSTKLKALIEVFIRGFCFEKLQESISLLHVCFWITRWHLFTSAHFNFMIYSCDIFYIQSVSVIKISIKFHKSMLTWLLMIISMEPFCMKHFVDAAWSARRWNVNLKWSNKFLWAWSACWCSQWAKYCFGNVSIAFISFNPLDSMIDSFK